MRLYLDATPVIVAVEQPNSMPPKLLGILLQTDVELYSSELALMESLIHPLRNRDTKLQDDFENFFQHQLAQRINCSAMVFRMAAEIRAEYGFRTPDAIHLACAVSSQCDVFLTNDVQFLRYPRIQVELMK